MENTEKLEQRIRQLELTVLSQKSCIQALHGIFIGHLFLTEEIDFIQQFNEQFENMLTSFIRGNFNNANISPKDYDSFINSAKKDFPLKTDFSSN
jgi:uncharacterized coiled-coil protein SlyX